MYSSILKYVAALWSVQIVDHLTHYDEVYITQMTDTNCGGKQLIQKFIEMWHTV